MGDEVAEDRRQAIDRDEHVARRTAARVADDERADADEPAVAADQRRAAPGRVRRRGEDRLVEEVFPAAGELALSDDAGGRHRVGAAEARDQHRIALLNLGRLAERNRRDLDRHERPQQAEPGLVVVSDDARRHCAPVVEADLRRLCLDHEIADGEHETVVVDDDAGAFPLPTQALDRAAVAFDRGLHPHDRRDQLVERPRLRWRGGNARRVGRGRISSGFSDRGQET